MSALDRVKAALPDYVQQGRVFKALCPCHADSHPSLEFEQGDRGVKMKCRAGCDTEAVVAKLGLRMSDLFDDAEKPAAAPGAKEDLGPILEAYTYNDEHWQPLFQVTRHVPKTFRQRRHTPDAKRKFRHVGADGVVRWQEENYAFGLADVRRVLYRLPELLRRRDGQEAFGVPPTPNPEVWVCEGEKDVHALEKAGLLATCNPMGANTPGKNEKKKWLPEYTETLRGFHVTLVRDKDEAGYGHVNALLADLTGVALSVRCVEAREGKDAHDHLSAGHVVEDFVEVDGSEEWPDPSGAPAKKKKSAGKLEPSQGILDAIADSGLPVIETNNRQLRDVTDESFHAIVQYNRERKSVFVRGGEMVRIVEDENGRATIQIVIDEYRIGLLARCANYVSTSEKRGTISVKPPESVAKDLAMLRPWTGIPALIDVSPCPVVAADGTIMRGRGYHEASRTFVAGGEDWPVLGMTGPEAARWIIEEVLGDFPFAKDEGASLANAISLMVTPFVRPLITSTVPFFLFDAPTAGTGKTWCAQTCLYPGLGAVDVKSPPTKEKDWNDIITTVLSSGAPALIIDNLVGKLESASFLGLLTSLTWSDRLFGKNTVWMSLPNRCVYVGTANNATIVEDYVSRTVPIRLDSGKERPEERTGFRHPNLMEWLASNRARCGAACVAMVQAWVDAGMPRSKKTMTRFMSWSEIVGGILDVCEVPNFLGNLERLREANDDEHILWSQFLAEWLEAFPFGEATVHEAFERMKESKTVDALVGGAKDDEAKRKRLGMLLNHRVDKVFGDTKIQRGSKAKLGRRFKITLLGDTNNTKTIPGGLSEGVSSQGDQGALQGISDTSPLRDEKPGTTGGSVSPQVQGDPYADAWHDVVSPEEEDPYAEP